MSQPIPQKEVCAAALEALLQTGADRRFEKVVKEGSQEYFVFRSRKNPNNSDACYLAGTRVMWRVESAVGISKGRWRTHPMDEKVSFSLTGDKLTITLEHSDRTKTTNNYSVSQIAKDMK
jgi:hypothetical protein